MKDCIKKLIYSFEQQNILALDEASVINEFNRSQGADMFNMSQSMSGVKKSGTAINKQSQYKMLLNNTSSVQKSQTPILPTLMGNQVSHRDTLKQNSINNESLISTSQQFNNNAGQATTPSNNEYMMLKRLNFLRNTLNSHHTKETTQFSREKANNIRDERILDLWKQDQEKPSVYEIV